MKKIYCEGEESLQKEMKGKNVVFLTTKQLSYIRNAQWIELLRDSAKHVKVGGNESKSYLKRTISVYIEGIKCVFDKDVQVIFAGFAPQLMLPLLCLYRIAGKTVVMDFFISMYDTFVCDRKRFKPGSAIANTLHWADGRTISKADYLIADTKAHMDYFVEEFGAEPQKCRTVYLKADEKIYWKREQKKTGELKEKFVVLYFGSVLPLQGVDIVLKAIKSLKDEKDICFIIVGDISKIDHVSKEDYKNTIFYKWLSQEELAEKIAMADLCLAGHFNNEIQKAKRTIAGKTYIYKNMDKPVVLGDNAANRELFCEKSGENYFVEMGNPQKLAEVILKAREDWRNRSDEYEN